MSRFEGAILTGVESVELGVVRSATQAPDSICDNLLDGGAAFGLNSILNDLSKYGGPFGANSPFNPDSLAPPQLFLDGHLVGHLTVSPFISHPVDPFALLNWLGCPVNSS